MEINPVFRETTSISIDSAYRTNGTSSNFKVLFKESVKDVEAYRIENISVPFSYIPYRQDLATLNFTITGSVSGVVNAILTNEPFTDTSLQPNLESKLGALLTGTTTVSFTGGRVSISNTAETLQLTSANLSASTGWTLIGFTIPVGPLNTIRGDKFYNLSGDDRIYLHSQIISGGNNFKINATEMVPTDSILSIPVNVNSGDKIYKWIPGSWCPVANSDIKAIDFTLRFGDGTIIDLNGLEWGADITFLKKRS